MAEEKGATDGNAPLNAEQGFLDVRQRSTDSTSLGDVAKESETTGTDQAEGIQDFSQTSKKSSSPDAMGGTSNSPNTSQAGTTQENLLRPEWPLFLPDEREMSAVALGMMAVQAYQLSAAKHPVGGQQNWKSSIRKSRKDCGLGYISRSGKAVEAKKVKEPCTETCFLRCYEKYSEEERLAIFNAYWQTADFYRQRDFIGTHVQVVSSNSRRKKKVDPKMQRTTRKYFLPLDGELTQVCFKFFCNTLDVKEKLIRYTLKEKNCASFRKVNKRVHVPHNKTSSDALEGVREHISKFPEIDTRPGSSKSSRQFLSSDLNVTKMYSMYREETEGPVSLKIYREVFKKDFNLDFQKVKKDHSQTSPPFKKRKSHKEGKTHARQGQEKESPVQSLASSERCREDSSSPNVSSSLISPDFSFTNASFGV